MSLFKIFWSNWFKSNFVKWYLLVSIFLILIFNFYLISFEKDLIYRLGGSFKIPYIFNLLYSLNYPFVFIYPVLIGFVSGIKDRDGSFLRYMFLSGYDKKSLFLFFQKNLLAISTLLSTFILFASLIIGLKEGISPKSITFLDFSWFPLYLIQGFAIGNFFYLVLILTRSLLKTILITFILAFVFEPILVYTLAESFNLFYYLPFRSINNLTFVEGMEFTISNTPNRLLNLLLAIAYIIITFFLNYRLFKRLSI